MWAIWSVSLLASLLNGVQAAAMDPNTGYPPNILVVRNPAYALDAVDNLATATMAKTSIWMDKKISMAMNNKCTMDNVAVRREWSDLSEAQRIEYTTAVKCLMKLPPKANTTRFSGAMSRYDDFVAYHMTHAMALHDNIHLFGAHRYFVYLYEKALRDECGYTGYQPYMNYNRYADDPLNSPLLNGNASSLGGNGEPDPKYKGIAQPGRTPNIIKSGGGGGCVTSGPFSDMVVYLGPTSMATGTDLPKNPRADGTGPNPRCLRRDVNRNAAMGASLDRELILMNKTDIDTFYNTLLGSPVPKGDAYPWGIHTAGHYVAPVDPGGDPNTSPGDPYFYFHHTALDRLWWIWQMQDPDKRLYALPFANTTYNMPMKQRRATGATEATDPMDTLVDMEWLGPPIKLSETADQLGGNGGAFCYIYV